MKRKRYKNASVDANLLLRFHKVKTMRFQKRISVVQALNVSLSQEFQDTTEYVKQEILNLEEEQRALDKVASKLESELRNAMNNKGKK